MFGFTVSYELAKNGKEITVTTENRKIINLF